MPGGAVVRLIKTVSETKISAKKALSMNKHIVKHFEY